MAANLERRSPYRASARNQHRQNWNEIFHILTLMVMLQSDWLNGRTLSTFYVRWLEVVYQMATFCRFSKVLKERFDANG